jgi:hypothetical protein
MVSFVPALSCVSLDLYCHGNLMNGFPRFKQNKEEEREKEKRKEGREEREKLTSISSLFWC